jgi:hypothetical protein
VSLRVGCALRFLFFLKRWKKYFEILFWVGEVEALLQFLVCALTSRKIGTSRANCKCAYTCAMAFTVFISHMSVFIVFSNESNLSLCTAMQSKSVGREKPT